MNRRFHKANAHYKSERTIGERTLVSREGKDPVEVLLYYPKETEKMPVFVQIHGGAWVGLDAVDDDIYCSRLSEALQALVVNVNYKRLYEKSFPYPQEEAADVIKWLIKNNEILQIDPDRIVISGGSAGGHISAGTAIMLAKEEIRIAGQILEVPALDLSGTIDIGEAEVMKLTQKLLDIYPPAIPVKSELLSPAVCLTEETLRNLCPAAIIVCGRDPLRVTGEAYAKLLENAGKLLDLKCYEKGYHGFGTVKAEEMVEQHLLREDCFIYKVQQAKEMYRLSSASGNELQL